MKVLDPGLRKVATSLYCALNTSRALTALILLRYGEWDQLAELATDPRNFLEGSVGAEKYRRDTQASDFLRKSPLLPLKRDKVAAAEATFWECEKQCFQTNAFLRDVLPYPLISDPEIVGRFRSILLRARKICGRILGEIPDDLEGAFGPGTSFELQGQTFSTLADKLWIKPTCTQECAPVFEHMFWRTLWGRTRLGLGLPLPGVNRGNRFTTVPKDSTKDRGICVEPLGNLWVQLGIGRYLKRRLAQVGLHVDRNKVNDDPLIKLTVRPRPNGQDVHRKLAQVGSENGEWATIDLSNASDTMAIELVRWVTPPDWFDLFWACRSPMTRIRKKWVLLDKFSSMGNGLTFELETLVFAVILAAGLDLKVGVNLFVYGDDIILPHDRYDDGLAILRMSGFTPNPKKCFGSGPFRESCGGDFFSGYPVRPVYSTKRMQSPLEWISLHNLLKPRFSGLHLQRCVEQVPSTLRLFGPNRLGDRVFHGPITHSWKEDGCTWTHAVFSVAKPIPFDRWGSEFTLCLALLGSSSQGIVPREPEMSFQRGKVSVS